MRQLTSVTLLALSATLSRLAFAQAPSTDACGPVVVKLQADCKPHVDAIDQKSNERRALAAAAPPDKAAIEQADSELKQLKAAAGVCAGVSNDPLPQDCGTLGSLLGGWVQTTGPLASAQSSRDADNQRLAATLPIAVQADRQTSSNKAGSSAQLDPVESVQPITLVGGAVSLSGTRSGTKAVGTMTVNPLALMSTKNVVASRVFDITVSAPFDLDGGTNQDNRYVSGRIRVNMFAPLSAARLQSAADKMTAMLRAEGAHSDQLEVILSKAQNKQACVDAIIKTRVVAAGACDEALDGKPIDEARAALLKELKDARREADSYYLGLDARVDSGDPTGTTFVGDKGTHILGGLAAGKRIQQGELWDVELRGRFAADYFRSRDDAAGDDKEPIWSADWGAAFILSGRLTDSAKQRLAFGVGVEGRQAVNREDAKRELAPTNYANLNFMAVVPAASGGDLGLGISLPLKDAAVPRGAIISLSTDLGLLDHAK